MIGINKKFFGTKLCRTIQIDGVTCFIGRECYNFFNFDFIQAEIMDCAPLMLVFIHSKGLYSLLFFVCSMDYIINTIKRVKSLSSSLISPKKNLKFLLLNFLHFILFVFITWKIIIFFNWHFFVKPLRFQWASSSSYKNCFIFEKIHFYFSNDLFINFNVLFSIL